MEGYKLSTPVLTKPVQKRSIQARSIYGNLSFSFFIQNS